MIASSDAIDTLLDMYGSLKDEVMELKEHTRNESHFSSGRQRTVAPGHTPDEPWTPCDQEEVRFYACLTYLH